MTERQSSDAWLEGAYSVKRHGVTIANCDTEPVQTPGCVQSHGVLLVLRRTDLVIRQVSENAEVLLGKSCHALLGQPVAVALGAEGEARLRDALDDGITDRNPLFLMTLPARADVRVFDVTVHTIEGSVLVEFEVTRRAEASEPDYFGSVKQTMSRLQAAVTLLDFCQIVVDDVRTLTGHDRVMIYKFHADDHGEVFAESKRDDLPTWVGLHYPADDIPKPARDIFKQLWVRPLPDAQAPLAEIVPLLHPDSGRPVTMTHCALRGASVMYTEYLQNMGVRASLTLSLRQKDALWGLVACHHYAGPYPVSYQVRAACELLAQLASLQLKAAEDREQLLYRLRIESVHNELVARAAHGAGFAALTDGEPALLDALAAGGAALYHRERWFTAGITPAEPQLAALAAWLNTRAEFTSLTRPLYATDALERDYPAGAAFAAVGSGVLAFPLSTARKIMIIWFRPETLQTVHWGGDPHAKPTVTGPHGPRLTPRKSFELFVESVAGRSQPWKTVELDAVARLRVLLMELVVGRAEGLAELNEELVRSNEELDAFAYVASHDLKEPLRGIHKYAHQLQEQLKESSDDQRQQLEGLMRLTTRMDSLLDSLLHFSRVGRAQLSYEQTDLDALLSEAIEMVSARAADARSEIACARPLPRVQCDRVRCREVFVNLLSNALKYSDKALRRIEVGYIAPNEDLPRPRCPEGAANRIIYYVRDDGIGIHARHFAQVFKLFKRLHGRDEYGGGTGAGLTIVKKLVERHGGQIWLDSTLGAGTTFYFTLPCETEV